ncbi:MAG: S8 family peptidase [Lachnospiraceae bacterium]|nr:S8 family peptidase [Lachnospiraceae bacterium]
MPCYPNSASEDYADFITRYYERPAEFLARAGTDCIDFVNYQFAVVHLPQAVARELTISTATYSAIPKLYALLDLTSLDAAGILSAAKLPPLSEQGRGVMIGFIDTGIDYQNPLFQNKDGSTRILGIWDQTLGNDSPGESHSPSIFPVSYGTQYTKEQIDAALRSENPLESVPSTDTNGHGTMVASIAAGNETADGSFSGAAPNCYLGIVKLKPAKQYLRDFFLIRENADAYQENDIMMGVSYLFALANQYHTPLVICLAVGTNMGSHTGTSNLSTFLNEMSTFPGTAFVVAAGNETGYAHHYRGFTSPGNQVHQVELNIGETTRGFSMEFCAQNTAAYTIGFRSPSGEVIEGPALRNMEADTLRFLLEGTKITVYSRIVSNADGSQLIFLRFQDPFPGIWTLTITNRTDISDSFHLWLPNRSFIPDDTYFLRPDPDTLITGPGNASYPITVGAYDHTTGGIYIHSSRGFSRSGVIKPELAAPGVGTLTGTSAAAAHVAGAAAILLNWGILQGNDPYMNSSTIKTYLIRGADRNPSLTYPNREFGYGTLNLYQAFLNLRI